MKQPGLVCSIKSQIDDIHLTGAMKIKFTHEQENNTVSQGRQLTVFRIVQELYPGPESGQECRATIQTCQPGLTLVEP